MRESDTEREFNIQKLIDQRKAIDIIKRYEEIIRTRNKKAITLVVIQGQMLKSWKVRKDLLKMIYWKFLVIITSTIFNTNFFLNSSLLSICNILLKQIFF